MDGTDHLRRMAIAAQRRAATYSAAARSMYDRAERYTLREVAAYQRHVGAEGRDARALAAGVQALVRSPEPPT